MRYIGLAVAALLFLALACSESVDAGQREAAEAVNAYLDLPDPVPYIEPGARLNPNAFKSDCVIGEGATTGYEPMPARCEWSAKQEGTETLVTFTERWDCDDFNERAGSDVFCRKKRASHTWYWAIDEKGEVRFLGDEGDTQAESFYIPSQ